METVSISETLVSTYKSTRRHNLTKLTVRSDCHEIPRTLWNMKDHYRVHSSPPPVIITEPDESNPHSQTIFTWLDRGETCRAVVSTCGTCAMYRNPKNSTQIPFKTKIYFLNLNIWRILVYFIWQKCNRNLLLVIIIIIRGATALTSLGRLSSHRWQSFPTAPDGTGLTCGQHIESHSCIFSFPNRTVTSLFK
jgi:hypothetical protein